MNFQEISGQAGKLLSLEGKVAMVTGAASGIGRGIAICLAEMGAAVSILDRDVAGGEAAASAIRQAGREADFISCDVCSRSECAEAVKRVIDARGRIDILCNNAGAIIRKDVVSLEEKEWNAVLDVTLSGVYRLSREVIPHMIRNGGGNIVNTGSGWSLKGGPKAAAYCAAKAGVLNLTRAMAVDYGGDNIRVNCVCPGDVDTPMLPEDARMRGLKWEDYLAGCANRPLGRIGTVEEIAKAALFLASDDSSFMTGAALVVDGGGIAD